MRAVGVTIHNFRSILDATIALPPYGLLVGENNAGKSNVVDAIRAFYEKGLKYDEERDRPKVQTDDAESWIEIQFKPTQDEFELLKDEYRLPDDTFRVRKYFKSTEPGSDGKLKTGIYAYIGGSLSETRFYGFTNVGQGKFGELIYIPAVSKLEDQTKLTGPSPLRDLVNSVLKPVMSKSQAYQDLKTSFERFEGSIKTETTDEGYSLESIERDITAEIAQWDTSFRLAVNPIGTDDLVKGLICPEIEDGVLGQAQPTNCYGQGFQRSLVFALIRVAARYSAQGSTPTKKRDFSPSLTWLLFEEPEAFLHPNQIDVLNVDLRKLASDANTQVLLTTHNPQFVSRNVEDLPGLARLRRVDGKTRVAQIAPPDLTTILAQNQAEVSRWYAAGLPVEQDDLTVDMESIKYILWLDPRRCGAFFADKVLLVEGPTEVALVNYLLEQETLQPPQGSFFVLDTMGKYNMHRFMNLLGKLSIRHYVLHDLDNGRLSMISQTIQDSRNAHTAGVDTFPDDLETFLGVTKAGKDHRKPQHVMYQLRQGKVTPHAIQSLVGKLEKLLSN